MIQIVSNLNNKEEKNNNNSGNNKKKLIRKNTEKSFASSLNPDLFISRSSGSVIPFEPIETKGFSFSDMLTDIRLFFINLINRMWWGPSYIKIKKRSKIIQKPIIIKSTRNPLTLNLSN